MVTQPEQPTDEPIVKETKPAEQEAAAKVEDKAEEDDTTPLTWKESIESGKRMAQTAKHGILKPAYRLGRRYLRSAQKATEAFFDGVVNEKQGKK